MIDVTAALIRRNGKVLICQRPAHKDHGLRWEFPGGKVEPGETLEDCIVRECMEELAVRLKPIRLFAVTEGAGAGSTVRLHFFVCEITEGEPTALEHAAIHWIHPNECVQYDFCEGDARMLSGNSLTSCLTDK